MRSARSNTVTECPARFNWSAAASPAGPDPTTATRLPVRHRRRLRDDPAFVERALDDRRFRGLDRHRRVVDAEHARSFARRRAQASGEFREVVRRVQPFDRGAPPIAIHEIVPVRNQVAERAALMAERNAAVHAARRLILQRRLLVRQRDFAPVAHALRDRARRRLLPLNLEEAGGLTHAPPAGRVDASRRPAPSPSRARACSRAASPS